MKFYSGSFKGKYHFRGQVIDGRKTLRCILIGGSCRVDSVGSG
jgi:hypothetical protein